MLNHQLFSRRTMMWPVLLACVLAAAPLGCFWSSKPQVTVPLWEDAKKQYDYAVYYRDQRNLPLIRDEKKYLQARQVVRETFQKVIDNFPENRVHTPLARLEIIDMDAVLDTQRIEPSAGQIHTAIEELKRLAEDYPEVEAIQAKTLYDQGLCHMRLREDPQAQECFRQARDRFGKSKNSDIKNIADRAAYYYNKTLVKE